MLGEEEVTELSQCGVSAQRIVTDPIHVRNFECCAMLVNNRYLVGSDTGFRLLRFRPVRIELLSLPLIFSNGLQCSLKSSLMNIYVNLLHKLLVFHAWNRS